MSSSENDSDLNEQCEEGQEDESDTTESDEFDDDSGEGEDDSGEEENDSGEEDDSEEEDEDDSDVDAKIDLKKAKGKQSILKQLRLLGAQNEDDSEEEDGSEEEDDESSDDENAYKKSILRLAQENDDSDDDDEDVSDEAESDEESSDAAKESEEEDEQPKKTKGKQVVREKKVVEAKPKISVEATKKDLKEKYAKSKGKSLYLRFPKRLPTDPKALEAHVKDLCQRIIQVRRPRQPGARFCLVDFENKEDCTKACKELRQVEVDGKRLQVRIPKTDSDDYIEQLVQNQRNKRSEKRAKKKLTKSLGEIKVGGKVFTSTILIRNIPTNASIDDVKSHFADALEFKTVQEKNSHGSDTLMVTFPTPRDATVAGRKKIKIGETKLSISFAGQKKSKKFKKTAKPEENEEGNPSNKQKLKKAKREADRDEINTAPAKKIKSESEKKPPKPNTSKAGKKGKREQESVPEIKREQSVDMEESSKQTKKLKHANKQHPAQKLKSSGPVHKSTGPIHKGPGNPNAQGFKKQKQPAAGQEPNKLKRAPTSYESDRTLDVEGRIKEEKTDNGPSRPKKFKGTGPSQGDRKPNFQPGKFGPGKKNFNRGSETNDIGRNQSQFKRPMDGEPRKFKGHPQNNGKSKFSQGGNFPKGKFSQGRNFSKNNNRPKFQKQGNFHKKPTQS